MSGHGRPVVVRTVERTDPSTVDALAPMGSATVHEAIGRRGFLGPDIRPIQSGARIAGTAVTALCHPGDNLMIHAAVETCEPGDILVVAVTAPSTHGFFGGLLATSLQARGVQGLVMDAAVRGATAELRAMGFAAWSRHVSCQGTVKATPGSVNVPVVIGGPQTSQPRRRCVRRRRRRGGGGPLGGCLALEMSQQRLAAEEDARARLAAGELGLDMHGLRQKLVEMGVDWVDTLDHPAG